MVTNVCYHGEYNTLFKIEIISKTRSLRYENFVQFADRFLLYIKLRLQHRKTMKIPAVLTGLVFTYIILYSISTDSGNKCI